MTKKMEVCVAVAESQAGKVFSLISPNNFWFYLKFQSLARLGANWLKAPEYGPYPIYQSKLLAISILTSPAKRLHPLPREKVTAFVQGPV